MPNKMNMRDTLKPPAADAAPTPTGERKGLTIKLSPVDYRRLRQLGVNIESTNQDICEAAIKAWLDQHGV